MPGTVDEKFISRLDDFTKALGGIVELLNEQKQKGNVDPINAMLGVMGNDLHKVVEDMQKVIGTTDRIEANTKEILQQLKANKEKKEKLGGFGEIAEVDNKQKIVDAIKIIGLITVGIVAVGLALKLISPVSMTSAIGIGLSIVFITGAFVMSHKLLGDLKFGRVFDISKMMILMAATLLATSMVLSLAPTINLSKAISLVFVATAMGTSLILITKAIENSKIRPEYYGKMMMLPIILPVIALGIVLSSWILSKIIPLTLSQGITTLLVAGAIGASLFLISKSLQHSKFEPGDVFKFLLLPIIVPALALGIVLSASILSNIKTLTIGQALSAIFVAGAIGVLIYLMKPAISKMKDFSLKEVIGVMGLVIALSVGLVGASWILNKMHLFTIGQAFGMIMTSAAIGMAILFLTPAVYILKSIDSKDMFKAAGNIIILAGAISASSLLLSFGDYSYAPDWKWAIGTGLSLAAFAGVAWIINKIGIENKKMVEIGLTMLAISATISLISIILGIGNYETYPSIEWSFGVGLSLVAFGAGMVALGLLMEAGGTSFMITGGLATLGVAITIAAVSQILGMGDYGDYPTVGWAFGVGLSMVAFGGAMVVLGILISSGIGTFMAVGAVATLGVALTIAAVSQILGLGEYGKYPSLDWASGVGLSMVGFGSAMVAIGILVMTGIGLAALGAGALGILLISSSIVAVSYILGTGNYSKYPTLDWATGAGLSLVAFGGSMLLIGFGLPLLYLGSLSMRLIANSIAEISQILSDGNYIGGPTLDWAKSTSLLMESFTKAMIDTAFYPNILLERGGIGLSIISQNIVDVSSILSTGNYSNGPNKDWAKSTSDLISTFASMGTMFILNPFLIMGLSQMMNVAQSISDSSNILGSGNYTGGPNKNWAEGVSLSIKAFAEGIAAMQETDGFFNFFGSEDYGQKIINIAQAMMIANQMLSSESWTNNYPTKAWAEGVGLSIKAFAEGLSALQNTDTVLGSIFGENQSEKIVTIANAMMEANMLLGSVNWSNNYPSKEWAEGVGTAIYAFAKPLAEMSAADMSTRDISRGIRRLALGIMEAAEILNMFDWNRIKTYPSLEWSQGVSTAINAFAKPLAEMSATDMSTRDISKGIRRLALSMVEAAIILDLIDWNEKYYPSQEWTNGVGNAIGTFTKYLIEIEKNDIGRGEIKNLGRVIDAMSSVAMKFSIYGSLGIWDNYPPQSWSEGVGGSIDKFVGYLKEFQKNKIEEEDISNLDNLMGSMINTALIFTLFGKGIWETYPPKSWTDGVGNVIKIFSDSISKISNLDNIEILDELASAIISFANKLSKLSKSSLFIEGGVINDFSKSIGDLMKNLPTMESSQSLNTFADTLIRISSMGITSTNSIMMLSKSISDLGESLKELDLKSIEKLSKLSSGFLILSLIDDKKLEDSIRMIRSSRDDIKSILSDQGKIIQSKTTIVEENIVKNSTAQSGESEEKNAFFGDMLNVVRNIDRNIDTISKSGGRMDLSAEDDEIEAGNPVNATGQKPVNSANPLYLSHKPYDGFP